VGITKRKGCAFGCGGILLLGALGILLIFGAMNRQHGGAANARTALIESYGPREGYEPGAGAAIAEDRLEAFLRIRRTLIPECRKLMEADLAMQGKRVLAGRGAVPKRKLAAIVGRFYGAGNQILNQSSFAKRRNEALLAEGMGFGEYAWIYSLTYYACLGREPILGKWRDEPGHLPPAARKAVADMMRRRAEALTAAGYDDRAELWQADADRLADSSYAVPFAGQAPPELAACVAARRDELEALFSPYSDPLEMMWLKEYGWGYEDH